MQQLNFCRQMKIQFQELIDSGMVEPVSQKALSICVSLAEESQKFILPKGGFLLEDKNIKGLDDNGRLNLPFDSIALEYESAETNLGPRDQPSTKRIIFAKQAEQGVTVIAVTYYDNIGFFHPYPPIFLHHSNFIDRTSLQDGFPAIKVRELKGLDCPLWDEQPWDRVVIDCAIEVRVLLGFLSALSCSNVKIDKQFSKKSAKTKSGIPFDDYHVLTVELAGRECGSAGGSGSHRSPREHLRRGHIRRLSDGRRIWVNAAVVCSGRGFGVVTKDYRVKH